MRRPGEGSRVAARTQVVSPRPVLGVVSTVSILGVLPVFLFAALFVMIREDIPLALTQLGLLTSVFYATAAISSVPAGVVCERLGPRWALRVSAAGSLVSLLGLSTVTRGFAEFVPWLVLGGIGDALSKPASNLGLGSLPKVRNLGLIFGIKQSAIPLTTMMAGAAVPLLGLTVGWRWTLVLLGSATLVAFGFADARSGLPRRRRTAAGAFNRRALSWDPPLVLIACGAGFGVAAGATMNAFYVESAVDIGLSTSAAGTALAACGGLTILTRLVAGTFIDRRKGETSFRTVGKMMLAGGAAVVALGLASSPAVFVAVSVIAFSAAWGWNGMFHFVLVRRYLDSPAAVTGVVSLGIFCGATVGPAGFGFLAARGGRSAGWFLLGSFLVSAAVCLFAAGREIARRALEDGRSTRLVPSTDP